MSASPHRLRRHYTDGPFGQIHFRAADAGRPIVLLHQSVMTGAQFDAVVGPLATRGYRPIAVDMPGFGASDAPPPAPTIGDYATCVIPVLDALDIPRAAVAGHHTGAMVATEAALAAPARIDAVVLHGAGTIADLPDGAALIEEVVAGERAFRALPGAEHMRMIAEQREGFAAGTVDAERISDYVVQAMLAYQNGAYWYGHNAAREYDHATSLRRLVQPTLLISNTGDIMHAYVPATRRLRPDFAYAEIAGGGIDVCDQAPLEWAGAIADFLDAHDR